MPHAMDARPDLATIVAELLDEVSAPAPYPPGHLRVLREAMALMAERGYGAASLRELARRLKMRQPSLYHYFGSKEELVEQIVQAYAGQALATGRDAPAMPTLAEGLRYALGRIIENHRSEEHALFMRFLFAIARELPQVQALARRLLLERGQTLMKRFVDFYVQQGELLESDSAHLVELTLNAVAMRMVSRHALFGPEDAHSDDDAFADFVVDCALRGVRARKEHAA